MWNSGKLKKRGRAETADVGSNYLTVSPWSNEGTASEKDCADPSGHHLNDQEAIQGQCKTEQQVDDKDRCRHVYAVVFGLALDLHKI
jgi:hypothetical protein